MARRDVRRSRQIPGRVVTTVADLERAGYDTWTSDESTTIAGWTLHATDGFTRRVNCATAVGAPDTSPSARTAINEWLIDRGAALVVRVTPLISPDTVEAITTDWGYHRVDETAVMAAPATESPQPDGVMVDRIDTAGFFTQINELNNRQDSSQPAWKRLLGRVADRGAGVTIGDIGVGLVVASPPYAAIYSVAVAPQARRQGHARSLMAAATNWAVDQGCDTMFLQVLGTNDPALGLYRTLGYGEAYRYSYLEPVQRDSIPAIDGC